MKAPEVRGPGGGGEPVAAAPARRPSALVVAVPAVVRPAARHSRRARQTRAGPRKARTKAARHVVVLGGGVVGVASAWFLSRSGCRVTLIERHEGAGLETSFANGGLVTPSMSDPWASPEIPRLILKWIGREDSPFLVRIGAVPGLVSWGLRFLRQCNQEHWRRNTRNILRLSTYSHECLRELVRETGVDYESNPFGTLHLFRDSLSMEKTSRTAEMLEELGVRSQTLDPAGCAALEPALKDQIDRIAGGIHYPDDEAGDAHLFSRRLAEVCASNGVELRYGETVQRIEAEGGKFSAVRTSAGRVAADACLVALGNESAALLRPLGIRLPIYPVKGYSLTFPVGGWNDAPIVPFADDGHKAGIVRIGDRIRVAGTAEFAGRDRTLNPKRIANLRYFFLSLFPDYPDRSAGDAWTGLRPMTPDGIPYLGPTPVEGLFVNTGHGHLGWTMSCGSASIVADLIRGKSPGIDLSGMTLEDR